MRDIREKELLGVKTEGVVVKEAFQLRIRPVKAKKIERRWLFSAEETYPAKIPQFQVEILAKMLEEGEVWHVAPRPIDIEETTLVLAAFDHKPAEDEITKKTVEKFLGESFQNGVSVKVKIQEGPITDFKDLKFEVSDNGGEETFDMSGLVREMRDRWFQSQRREKPPETEEVEAEKWDGLWRTFPVGTNIYTGPLSSRGLHVEVQETIKKRRPHPIISIEVDDKEGLVYYNLLRGGYVTRVWGRNEYK